MIQDHPEPSVAGNTPTANVSLEPASQHAKDMLLRSDIVPRICQVVKEHCSAAFGARLTSLILTGSTARSESTILAAGSTWKILGDAEFLILVRQESAADEELAASVSTKSAKELFKHGINVSVDVAVVTASYLQNLPPYIFSYELRTCGKIISGDSRVLSLIPKFSAMQVSREDAWRLLCNRMIEHLAFIDDLETSPSELTPRLEYATVKLYLDMATSYLVFSGNYAPTYRERADRLLTMAQNRANDAPFPLAKLAARVADCTAWKLSRDETLAENGHEFWHEGISYMRRLWRWEVIQLTHAAGELTVSSLTGYLARQQTAGQWLRSWMSAAKRNGWLKSVLQAPRWTRLALRSTPRYLVYQVAAEIAFRLPCLVKHSGQPPRLDLNWRDLRNLLPMQAPEQALLRRPAWRQAADDVLWNYSHLLRDTRA